MSINKVSITLDNLDTILANYGIKYIFVESGSLAIKDKCEEIGIDPSECTNANYWCELSWGSDDEDKYDFAYNEFGKTLGEAIVQCLIAFNEHVRQGGENNKQQVGAAKDVGIYEYIMGDV